MRRVLMLAMAAALLLCGQPGAAEEPVHRIGVLFSIGDSEIVDAWQKGLRDHGYIEGRNLLVEYRYHQISPSGFPHLPPNLPRLSRD